VVAMTLEHASQRGDVHTVSFEQIPAITCAKLLKPPFVSHDPAMKTLHELVADKLEQADPASRAGLLRIPLENIDRWLANGHTAPHRLEQWREILRRAMESAEGFQELLKVLRDPGEEAVHLRSFDPFPGVLTTLERRKILLQCAYAH